MNAALRHVILRRPTEQLSSAGARLRRRRAEQLRLAAASRARLGSGGRFRRVRVGLYRAVGQSQLLACVNDDCAVEGARCRIIGKGNQGHTQQAGADTAVQAIAGARPGVLIVMIVGVTHSMRMLIVSGVVERRAGRKGRCRRDHSGRSICHDQQQLGQAGQEHRPHALRLSPALLGNQGRANSASSASCLRANMSRASEAVIRVDIPGPPSPTKRSALGSPFSRDAGFWSFDA